MGVKRCHTVDKTPTVFENRVLRKISAHKGEGETGGYRRDYNEELHDFYSSNRSAGNTACKGDKCTYGV
jgi:hypothetical protein